MAKDTVIKRLDTVEFVAKNEEVFVGTVAPKKAEPALLVSFDRWFATTGKPAHWKSGMRAYANTIGKKTLEVWAKIFSNY